MALSGRGKGRHTHLSLWLLQISDTVCGLPVLPPLLKGVRPSHGGKDCWFTNRPRTQFGERRRKGRPLQVGRRKVSRARELICLGCHKTSRSLCCRQRLPGWERGLRGQPVVRASHAFPQRSPPLASLSPHLLLLLPIG